jgi:glycosyltransferase involved in cell wall biosynthesis
MRILFATYSLAFQNPGGGERVLLALRQQLESQGHQIDIFDPWKHRLDHYDLIHYFSCVEKAFWSHSKSIAPHIPMVVTPTAYFPPGLKTRISSLKVRFLNHFENPHQESSNPWRHLKKPDLWLPTTLAESQALTNYWGISQKKIQVLPNGVDSAFFNAEPDLFRRETGVQGPFVLHVGRFHPVKNQLSLIEAVRLAQLECVFIGSPDTDRLSYYDECVQAAEAAMKSDPSGRTRFHFIPAVHHTDPLLPSAYSASSVFALPSEFETFGIAALEAGAAGTQLLLTQNIKNKEGLEEYASFLDPKNVTAWSEQLHRMIQGPSADTHLSRQKLQGQYDWKAVAENLIDIYQTVM